MAAGRIQHASSRAVLLLSMLLCPAISAAANAPADLLITNARVMTVTHGTIEHGSVWVHEGKIAGIGETVDAPRSARTIDAGGRYLTPGIIDAHAHIGMGGEFDPQDTNEFEGKPWGRYAGPIQADLRIRDSIKADDYGFYLMLSAGLTTVLELPGSANLFGGQTVPMKMKVGRSREEMFIDDAPMSLKIACGSTPARAWKGRGVGLEAPADVLVERRKAYAAARDYLQRWKDYRARLAAGETVSPPAKDAKLEAIGQALEGKALLQMHCHDAGEIAGELRAAREFGFSIRTIHHATEAYKIAKEIADAGSAVLAITDIWGGAPQVANGIPWNVILDKQAGVRVALHGEAFSIAKRLPQEAGKIMRYSGGAFDRNEALALVTLNAAWTFGLDDRIGSIDVGKDADLVIWEGDPLSSFGHAGKVFIDGELFFDASLSGLGLVTPEGAEQ